MKVTIICKFVHEFREAFFNDLRATLAESDIELELLYGRPAGAEATKGNWVDIEWATYVDTREIDVLGRQLAYMPVMRLTADSDLVIVEQASKLLENYPLLARSQVRRRPKFAFWGHGRNIGQEVDAIGEKAKTLMTKRSDWFFAYTDSTASYLGGIDYPADRLTTVQNSIDTRSLKADLDAITENELAEFREATGFAADSRIAVSVGSLYDAKRPQFMIDAARAAHATDPSFRLLIVGGGPLADEVAAETAQDDFIHYSAPLHGTQKALALAVADVYWMPGVGGLSIVDAFVAGLPIVICENQYHPPEFDYISDQNSLVLPTDAEATDFAKATLDLLHDTGRFTELHQQSLADGSRYGLDSMVQNFAAGVVAALAS